MKITNEKLQQHYDRVIAVAESFEPGQARIFALMDAVGWFRLIEGESSEPATEATALLTSQELRASLHQWYSHHGDNMNPAALEFRHHLSAIIGEKLG
jgi:hypothetical protein